MRSNASSGTTSITAASDIARGTIATTTGGISTTSRNIQTLQGTVSSNNGVFQNLARQTVDIYAWALKQTLEVVWISALTPTYTLLLQQC